MDTVSQQRLAGLHPKLADLVTKLMTQLEGEGIETRIVQGLRTWAEQDELYAQGRTKPGPEVTKARGGYSFHCFSLAVDIVPSTHAPGQPFDPDWHKEHPTWKRMEDLGAQLGLVSGAAWRSFPDAPHFQLTGSLPEGAPTTEARVAYQNAGGGTAGIQAVWELAGL